MFTIIKETPLWVWFIFIYLIVVGVKATHDRIVPISRFFITPFIFVTLKYKIFLTYNGLYFFFMIALFTAFFYSYIPEKQSIEVHKNSIKLKGSYTPLFIFMSFFVAKYWLGYNIKKFPNVLSYVYADLILSAFFTGYFLGNACQFYKKSRECR